MHRLPLLALLSLWLPLAGARAAEPRDDAAAEKLGWHLATKAYTFRNRTLFETIEVGHALGVKFLEMNPNQKLSPDDPAKVGPALTPEQIAKLKEKLAAEQVTAVSFGVQVLKNDEAFDRTIFDFAKSLGLQAIVSEPPPDAFSLLDKLTAEYGIKVAVHNHPKPNPNWQPENELKEFAACSDRIGACADVGHWTRSGLDAVDCLRQLQGRIVQLHFKDVSAEKKDVPWGTGTSNVRGLLEELHRQKFQGIFSMEYESPSAGDLVGELRQSIAYFDQEARRIVAEGK